MQLFFTCLVLLLANNLWAQSTTTIKGQAIGLREGQKVILYQQSYGQTLKELTQTRTDGQGFFELTSTLSPDLYQLKIGNRSIQLLLKGNEQLQIEATFDQHLLSSYTITGSTQSQQLKQWQDKPPMVISKELPSLIHTQPLLSYYLVQQLPLPQYVKDYQSVLKVLKKHYSSAPFIAPITISIQKAKRAAPSVAIGQAVPAVKLPDLYGEKTALKSLKGKVVLVDFWASWCRPCRLAHPHLNKLYQSYKKKGFTIYSISLDGIDDKTAKQLSKSALKAAKEKAYKQWKSAVNTDQLKWPHHVSELKKWDGNTDNVFNITSIPASFLIDKKGIVRYKNLQGAELEAAIQTLLKE